MSLALDPEECLKQAMLCLEMANAATSAEVQNHYLELAKHYTALAAALQISPEFHSGPEKLRKN